MRTPKLRKHQDMFLMEDVDVVVATIAFGMELINQMCVLWYHDIPKSLEVIQKQVVQVVTVAKTLFSILLV
jgi:superfamily II DNA helicase RecQ